MDAIPHTLYKMRRPAIVFILLSLVGLLPGCASETPVVAKDGQTISNVHIKIIGATNKARPNMENICKGFILSRQQVQTFFVFAYPVKDAGIDNSYDILPCYVSGTAEINNKLYNWIIRSGGVGEFFNKTGRFLKICGKGCCSRIAGIC